MVLQVMEMDHPEVVQTVQVTRIHDTGPFEVLDRFLELPITTVHHALVGQHVRIVRIELERFLVGDDRLAVSSVVEEPVAEFDPRLAIRGIGGDTVLEDGDGVRNRRRLGRRPRSERTRRRGRAPPASLSPPGPWGVH